MKSRDPKVRRRLQAEITYRRRGDEYRSAKEHFDYLKKQVMAFSTLSYNEIVALKEQYNEAWHQLGVADRRLMRSRLKLLELQDSGDETRT